MNQLFLPYLTVVGWVLGPVLIGAIWARMGAPASASRKLFNFSFYGALRAAGAIENLMV